MLKFITRRSLLALLILLLAVSLLFAMIHMMPGDPASVILGPKASPALKAELNQRMGLDQPLPVQMVRFFSDLAHGDLGSRRVFRAPGVCNRIRTTALHTRTGAGGHRLRKLAGNSTGLLFGHQAQLGAGSCDCRDVGCFHCHPVFRGSPVPAALAGGQMALVPGHGCGCRRRHR